MINIGNSPRRDEYKTYLNELFLKISALLENNQFKGDIPNLFRLIYQWYNIVPVCALCNFYLCQRIVIFIESYICFSTGAADNSINRLFC